MKTIQRFISLFFCYMMLFFLFGMSVYASDDAADAFNLPAPELAVPAELPALDDADISDGQENIPEVTATAETIPAEAEVAEEPAEAPVEAVQTDGATQVSSVTIWDGEMEGAVPIKLDYTEYYSKAFDALEYINEVRADYGLYPLKMDAALMEGSMIRAAENTVWWEHRRANGEIFQTTCSIAQVEIIAKVYPTPVQAVNGWLNSSSHRSVVLTSYYTHIGIGCVYIDGNWFWAAHGSTKYYDLASREDYTDRKVTKTVYMKPSYMDGLFTISLQGSTSAMYPGDTARLAVEYYSDTYDYGFDVPVSGLTMYSTDLSVCTVDENGIITCTGPGTASIVAYYEGYQEGAAVFSVTGRGSTTVLVTGPSPLSGVSGRIYSASMSEEDIRTDMKKSGSSSALYSASSSATGTEVSLTFRDVPHGEYKIALHAGGGYIVSVETITVDDTGAETTYVLRLYGDVDASGTVDPVDALEVFNHSCGLFSLLDNTPFPAEDAIRQICADVNLDGTIDIRDATQILRRANGLKSCIDTIA